MSDTIPIALPSDPPVTVELARALGLTENEYRVIEARLGRRPTYTELGVFSVMWSEHCSYKSSKLHLRQLPHSGRAVVRGPGENAGAIEIGDGWLAVFKIESHNHPSYVEPYQGAATGVGGIIRDILAMGARPIATLNSLKFGDFDYPRMTYLVRGVVGGIGGYGNCVGVPTVGGEASFSKEYNKNILVNVFCLGLARKGELMSASAKSVGSAVIYAGSATGRDGIHGASLLASAEFDSAEKSKRPSVQVGDPFMGKILIEACLEAFATGAVEACQDMGAAGLTSSSSELAARGGLGIELDLDKVPLREPALTPYEILLSESQERMLLLVCPGREGEVLSVFRKWDLPACVVGRIVAENRWRAFYRGALVADIPVNALTVDAPVYNRPVKARPVARDYSHSSTLCKSRGELEHGEVLRVLIGSPNVASKRWIYRQFDYLVQSNTLVEPGGDAAVLRIKGTQRALAIAVDSNFRLCARDPYIGAVAAVCEAALNVACVGATPVGITDCLNYGSPERPEVMWEFARSVEGIRDAALALEIPVVSGNVSFYNETDGQPIPPTPTIAVVGVLNERAHRLSSYFKRADDAVALVKGGKLRLAATAYEALLEQKRSGVSFGWVLPPIEPELVKATVDALSEAAALGIVSSAHDVSEGGIGVALVECCFNPNGVLGVEVSLDGLDELGVGEALFAEGTPLVIVSLPEANLERAAKVFTDRGLEFKTLGKVKNEPKLTVKDLIDEDCNALWEVYHRALPRRLGEHV